MLYNKHTSHWIICNFFFFSYSNRPRHFPQCIKVTNFILKLIFSYKTYFVSYYVSWNFICPPVQCCPVNSLRLRPNRRHFADDIFKCILENENGWISPRISLKFVPKVRINNIPALVEIMAWRRPGDKPLSGPMMVSLLTHICVIRPQWVKTWSIFFIKTCVLAINTT